MSIKIDVEPKFCTPQGYMIQRDPRRRGRQWLAYLRTGEIEYCTTYDEAVQAVRNHIGGWKVAE